MNVGSLVLGLLLIFSAIPQVRAKDFAAFTNAGELARQRGDFVPALAEFERAFEGAVKADDRTGQARALIGRGHVFYLKAEYNSAIQAFRRAEKLAREANDRREEARAWAFLGQLYWRVGKHEDSRMFLGDALRVFEEANDEINLALVLRFIGRFEDGRPTAATGFSPVVTRLSDSDWKYQDGISRNGRYALELLERSLAISRRIGDEEGEFVTLKEIGLVHQTQMRTAAQLEKAMSYFRPLRERLRTSNYRWLYGVLLNNIATNQYQSGANLFGTEAAAEPFRNSIATADDAALIFRETGDRQELREVLVRKSTALFMLGRFEESLTVMDEGIKLAEDLFYQPIGDVLDSGRYAESLSDSYRQKINSLARLRRPAQMLETLESMRSLTLRRFLESDNQIRLRGLTTDEQIAQKSLDDEISATNREIALASETRRPELTRRLQKARLAKEEWLGNIAATQKSAIIPAKTPSFERICAAIPDEQTALLSFNASGAHLFETFVVFKTEPGYAPAKTRIRNLLTETIEMPDGQNCTVHAFYHKDYVEVEPALFKDYIAERLNRVGELHEQMASKSPAFKGNARFLYDALLSDAVPLLGGKKHLVIVPGGPLADVPFQALINEKGRYLIEDFSISYAPSLTTLAEMQTNRGKLLSFQYEGEFLAFGNPRLSTETVAKVRGGYRDGKLQNLPEAESEVKKIGGFYRSKRILTGAGATEEAWRESAANYRFLHLATHGLSNSEKPLYSHVLLSAGADDDGLIEAREITETRLNAEMVVLSACETARGREIDGEGMVGLAWAFSAAGVPTVVASNWRVDSAATSEFMISFYSKINDKPRVSSAAALQSVMIERIRSTKTSHPFYWAGLSLYGVWNY